jgi:hypothetical protein
VQQSRACSSLSAVACVAPACLLTSHSLLSLQPTLTDRARMHPSIQSTLLSVAQASTTLHKQGRCQLALKIVRWLAASAADTC